MTFLENLTDLLYFNKMSRSDLARALNIPPSTINSWYNRSCENVALKTVVDIAKYFDVSLDDLVNGTVTIKAELSDTERQRLERLLDYHNKYYTALINMKGGNDND